MKVSPRSQMLIALLLATTAAYAASKAKTPAFGPNVAVFSPTTPAAEIQAQIDKVYAIQQHNQFGGDRNAFLFLPGEYKVDVPIGFYTEVLGLGATPNATHITGNVRSEAATRAIEVPSTPGVRFHHMITVALGNLGSIDNVINNTGGATQIKPRVTPKVTSYP